MTIFHKIVRKSNKFERILKQFLQTICTLIFDVTCKLCQFWVFIHEQHSWTKQVLPSTTFANSWLHRETPRTEICTELCWKQRQCSNSSQIKKYKRKQQKHENSSFAWWDLTAADRKIKWFIAFGGLSECQQRAEAAAATAEKYDIPQQRFIFSLITT